MIISRSAPRGHDSAWTVASGSFGVHFGLTAGGSHGAEVDVPFAFEDQIFKAGGSAATTRVSRVFRDSSVVTGATPLAEIIAKGKMSDEAGHPGAPVENGPVTDSSACSCARALIKA